MAVGYIFMSVSCLNKWYCFFLINESVFGLGVFKLCIKLPHYFNFMDFWIEILFKYIDLCAIRLCIFKSYHLFCDNFYFAHYISCSTESHRLICSLSQSIFSCGLKLNYAINWKINYNGRIMLNPVVYYFLNKCLCSFYKMTLCWTSINILVLLNKAY